MSEELRLDGMGVDADVLTTIVTLAAEKVEGVACVEKGGIPAFRRKGATRGVSVAVPAEEDDGLRVSLHVSLKYGQPLRAVAARIQHAVAEALESMTGQRVGGVDVFIDGIVFAE